MYADAFSWHGEEALEIAASDLFATEYELVALKKVDCYQDFAAINTFSACFYIVPCRVATETSDTQRFLSTSVYISSDGCGNWESEIDFLFMHVSLN